MHKVTVIGEAEKELGLQVQKPPGPPHYAPVYTTCLLNVEKMLRNLTILDTRIIYFKGLQMCSTSAFFFFFFFFDETKFGSSFHRKIQNISAGSGLLLDTGVLTFKRCVNGATCSIVNHVFFRGQKEEQRKIQNENKVFLFKKYIYEKDKAHSGSVTKIEVFIFSI